MKIARKIGGARGIVRFEIASTLRNRTQTFTGEKSYMIAVLPAILAANAIAAGQFPYRAIVPPTAHVDPAKLFEAIRAEGIDISTG